MKTTIKQFKNNNLVIEIYNYLAGGIAIRYTGIHNENNTNWDHINKIYDTVEKAERYVKKYLLK